MQPGEKNMIISKDGKKTYQIGQDGTRDEICIKIGQDHLSKNEFVIVSETDTEIEEMGIYLSQISAFEDWKQQCQKAQELYGDKWFVYIIRPGWQPLFSAIIHD
ncbi:TPA: hypothetical protein DD617_00435 [Candidatus Uhrbacteria bacterium]|nr:hypothetical protein [Candidatus Uhrbacteria bacterium]